MTSTVEQRETRDVAVVSLHHAKHGDALPVSHYINSDASVRRQNYWQGKPSHLAGFVRYVTSPSLDVPHEAFWRDPMVAVGMYAAFFCSDGSRLVMPTPVERIFIHEKAGA